MPAHIINGIIQYLSQVDQLDANIFDGEIPRFDPNGNPIRPGSVVSPSNWPVLKVYMSEQGFSGTWTTEDAYDDVGLIMLRIWAVTRAECEALLNAAEAALVSAHNWQGISAIIAGTSINPYYIIQIIRVRWSCFQEESVRTSLGELLYQGQMDFEVMIHGAVSTY